MKEFHNPSFINTSEAFSLSVFISNDTLIIPFIGLNIMLNNPFTATEGYLDFSYYIFEKVSSFRVESESTKIIGKHSQESNPIRTENIIVGGFNEEFSGAEIEIMFSNSFLFLPDDVKYSKFPFVPKDYPLMEANMNMHNVHIFFSLVDAPDIVKNKLANNYWTITV
ncbi:MAG: hypothetical protein KF862_16670 [Chitinophagaceae bacterium]|nr:hypothetical protein [Chitinophagaceae bacterium]